MDGSAETPGLSIRRSFQCGCERNNEARGGAALRRARWSELPVVGLQRWGGGTRRQQSWLSQSGSRASAVQKRLGTAGLL